MTDDLRQFIRDIFVLLFGSVSGFVIQHWRRRQEVRDVHDDFQNKTIQTQGKTLADAFDEIEELRKLYRTSERRQKIQWAYIIRMLEDYRIRGLDAPEPPEELKTDPDIIRLTKRSM